MRKQGIGDENNVGNKINKIMPFTPHALATATPERQTGKVSEKVDLESFGGAPEKIRPVA